MTDPIERLRDKFRPAASKGEWMTVAGVWVMPVAEHNNVLRETLITIADMRARIIDLSAMLEHYASGRQENWDGSTRAQALSCLRDAKALLAKLDQERAV